MASRARSIVRELLAKKYVVAAVGFQSGDCDDLKLGFSKFHLAYKKAELISNN